jgi:3-phenylpropionate/trans-cinnamate dioxygenase ferredoxin reductase subunit
MGRSVTLVTTRPLPLEHALGPEVAAVYARVHDENGVRFVSGRVAELRGNRSVETVRLEDGRILQAHMVVAGVGAAPRVGLAQQAGLELADGGVAVDEYLRTSAPGVFAAGDVAAAWNPRYGQRLRVEHWDNGRRQGRTAAANMVGELLPYERVPYLYSDQFELGMEYRGFAPRWDEVVIRGDTERREFDAFWLADGRLLAAMNVNRWDDAKPLQRLVKLAARVDPARLADVDVPLDDLVPVAATGA